MNESVLDSIFGTGADDILTPEAEGLKDSSKVTGNILDAAADDKIKPEDKVVEQIAPVAVNEEKGKSVLSDVIEENTPGAEEEIVEPVAADKGRPKTDKSAMVSYLKDKIEANDFGILDNMEFDSKKETVEQLLNRLPEKELHNLLDSNWKAKEDEIRAQSPGEFYEALPDEAKLVAEYAARGGSDWKAFYAALGKVEEVRSLDPAKEDDQALIARSYLQATGWKPEAINEQIEQWKESGKIEKMAKQFKPELDDMQKQQADVYIKQAEDHKKQQAELAKFYTGNVYKTLEKNEIAGIKLDKRFARELEDNMTSTAPGPWSGKPVNYLGYGLENAQYINPDYEAVMLAAMILNDKAGTLEKIRQQGANTAVNDTVKLIKLGQGGLGSASAVIPELEKVVKRIINPRRELKQIKS